MKNIAKLLTIFLPLLLATACDVTMPSQVKTGKIRVEETTKTESWSAYGVNQTALDNLARDYHQNGRGDVTAVISYKGNNPAHEIAAKKQAADYVSAFKKEGIPLKASVVSVPDEQAAGRAVVSYNAMVALPPEDCTRMTGYQGADSINDVKKYEMGCEVKSNLSRMIVRSEDLMGGKSATDIESRRAGATVDKYINGVKNEKIEGIAASKVGQ